MNSALLNQQGQDAEHATAAEYATAAAAVSAFVASGSREWIAQTLAGDYARKLGRDSVVDAVDHALERALTDLKPNQSGVYPARSLYRFVATAAANRLVNEIEHNSCAAAPVARVAPNVAERVIDRHAATPEELWLEGELAHQVREAAAGLDELTLQILWLRHVERMKKPQIEAQLGLTAKRVRTLLRAGNEKLCTLFQGVEAGTTCGGRRDGVLRLAFDLATGQEARRARAHVGHCRECARRFERARAYRRTVAGVIPFPVASHAPTLALLDQLRLLVGRLFGQGGEDASRTVLTARGGTGAASAAALKLLGICTAGIAVTGGVYCALNGLPGQHRTRHPAPARTVHIAAALPTTTTAAASAPSPGAEHAQLVRAAARKAERIRARRAAARKRATSRKATQPDEFFSPYANPGSSPQPTATTTSTAPTQPVPKQTSTSSQSTEFPLP